MFTTLGRHLPLMAMVGLAAAAAVYLFLPEPIEVDTARAGKGNLVATVDEEGRAVVRRRYTISAPITGSVLRVTPEPGDVVASGAVLARMVPAPIDTRTHAQLTARREAARAGLERARADEQAAQAAYQFALTDHERLGALGNAGAISRSEIDSALARRDAAEGHVKAAAAAVRAAAHDVEAADAAVLTAAQPGPVGSYVDVRAPTQGVLLRVFQQSERVLAAGTPLVEIGDIATLEMVVDLLSADAVRIPPGASATIDRWGGPDRLHGRVRLIEPGSFTKISALGVEEQRVNVFIELTDPPARWSRLGDGFAGDVSIVTAERRGVIKVPAGALFRDEEGWSAFVMVGRRARQRPVSIGLRAGYDVEVLSGLAEGEEVVLFPPERVVDGARIVRR
jgi:HlyD family secretion protein